MRLASINNKRVNDHWQDTVKQKVELNTIKEFLTSEQLNLFDDINKRYDEAVTQYKLNGVVGQAILGPYSPGSDSVARTHLSHRSGWFE